MAQAGSVSPPEYVFPLQVPRKKACEFERARWSRLLTVPGDSKRFGDVIIGEVFDVSQHDDDAVIGFQILERFGEQALSLGAVHACIWPALRVGELSRWAVGIGVAIQWFVSAVGPAPIVQALVFALVDGDSEEPGGELGVASEVPHRPIGAEKDVLCDLFCESTLSELRRKQTV